MKYSDIQYSHMVPKENQPLRFLSFSRLDNGIVCAFGGIVIMKVEWERMSSYVSA